MHILEAKEKKYGAPMMRELERICLLRNVDSKWMDHIDNMDQLKQGMGLRGYGQHDPVTEYRVEGFQMFDEMVATIREDAVHMLLTIEVRRPEVQPKREQVGQPTGEGAPARPRRQGQRPGARAEDRPQRPLPLRQRPEVEEVQVQGISPRPVISHPGRRRARWARRLRFCKTEETG